MTSLNEPIVEDAELPWFGELGDAVGCGLHPSHAMSRPFLAPTGHHAIALGSALGIRRQTVPRPEGAQPGTGIRRDRFHQPHDSQDGMAMNKPLDDILSPTP